MSRMLQNLQMGLEFTRESPWGQARPRAWAFLSRYRASAFKVYRRVPDGDRAGAAKPAIVQDVARTTQRFTPLGASRELTLVEARVDLGLGHAVFIRGEGAGLSWQKG